MSFKRFDVAAELQNLSSTPAKVANPAKVTPSVFSEASHFSNFSRFSRREPAKTHNQQAPSGNRDFLSRPLGQEENPDAWDAWTPFMLWLLEHHPEHYYAVCEAEDVITAMERSGIVAGPEYETACQTLRHRFETARKLALKERVKVWMQ